jgi:hypothetical protein
MTFGATDNTTNVVSIKGVENIVYVGVNNLGSGNTANAAAVKSATDAATALAAATAAKVAADAAKATTLAEEFAAAEISTYVTGGGTTAEEKIAAAKIAVATPGATTNYSVAQYNAAAAAAQVNAAGTTLITTADDTTALVARADVLETLTIAADAAADAAVTAANAALATARFNNINATAVAAATKAALGKVTIAANTEATSITIDGTTTTVTGLKDTQTLTIKASSVANTASYAAAATVANIALSSATGTVTISDGGATDASAAAKALATANVTGTVKATAATTSASVATPGAITLVDAVTGTSALKTLTLGLTSDASVTADGMAAVRTIDASSSTGGIALGTSSASTIGTGVMNITTGAGKDTIFFNPATTATTTATLTASLNTGAGNDTITVNHTGGGTATVNAGAGDDSVVFTSGLGTATIDGGDGKDTIRVINTSFSTGGYNSLKSSVTNFEVLAFSDTAAVDAAKAAQFSEYTFRKSTSLTNNNFISKVADTQVINTIANDVVINAAGYVAKGSTDADGVTATNTTYAGAMTVSARGGSATADANATDVIVNASSVTLNVSVNPTAGTLDNTPTYVALSGDVKTATVNVNKGVNNTGLPASEIASTVEIVINTTANSGASNEANGFSSVTLANTALNALGNLSSLTLTGTGVAIVNNASGTKLASVDASGMNGTVTFGATAGAAAAGLSWTAGNVAETVKLGSTLDTLTIATANSNYAKMDSITGFSLVADSAGSLVAGKSDNLTGTIAGTYVAKTTGVSGSLDAALTAAGNHTVGGAASNLVVFQNGGNTYIFQDLAAGGTSVAGLDDGDVVIELVGLVNLDLLIADLAA